MKRLETELCAYSLEAVGTAARLGVTRVELCASPLEGGTTPPAAAITVARVVTSHLAVLEGSLPVELSVMIRPRGGDFLYSDVEFAQMRHEIVYAKESGADGVVLGILDAEGDVDVARVRELVALAAPLECTFHRAFDVTRDWRRALEDVVSTGCRRILTSGPRATAPEGCSVIRELVALADGRIEIMAGSGVNPGNARELAAAGVDALHFSASAVREGGMKYRGGDVVFSPGGAFDHQISYADPEFVARMVAIAAEARL
jgi:copper homeostasis protein